MTSTTSAALAVLFLLVLSCGASAAPQKLPPHQGTTPVNLTAAQVARFEALIEAHGRPRFLVVHPVDVPHAVRTFAAEFRNYLTQCRAEVLDLGRLDAALGREVQNSALTDDLASLRQRAARLESDADARQAHLVADVIVRIQGHTEGDVFDTTIRLIDVRRGSELTGMGFAIPLDATPYKLRQFGVEVFVECSAALERSQDSAWRFSAFVYGFDHGRVADTFVDAIDEMARSDDRLVGSDRRRPNVRSEWNDQRGVGSRLTIEIDHWGRPRDVRDLLHEAAAELDPPLRLEFTSRSPVVSIAYALDAARPAWECAIDHACGGDLRAALVDFARREGRNRFAIVLEESTAVDPDYFRGLADAIAGHFRAINFERVAESEDDGGAVPDYVVRIGAGTIDGQRSMTVRLVRAHDGRHVEVASEFWPNPVFRSTGEVRVDDRDPRSLGRYLGGSLLAQFAEASARDGSQRRILVTVSDVEPTLINDVRQRLSALPAQRRLGRADLVERTWQVELWYGGSLDDLKVQVTDQFRGSELTVHEVSDRGVRLGRVG